MKDERNICEIAGLAPDFLGFIFFQKSPRFVGYDFKIPNGLESVKRVGVFVNEATNVMLQKVRDYQLDYLQLHGRETVEQCRELRNKKIKLIKVFAIDDGTDFSQTKPYSEAVDFFLFDTKGKYYGGNAQAFNWKMLSKYDQALPFFLSGGIGPDNVEAVKELKEMNLYAVDVNSGVEKAPGLKDIEKIKKLKDILKR